MSSAQERLQRFREHARAGKTTASSQSGTGPLSPVEGELDAATQHDIAVCVREAAWAFNAEQRDPTRRKPLFGSLAEVHRDLPFYRFAARRALKDAGAESAVVVRTRRLSARELDAWMAAALGAGPAQQPQDAPAEASHARGGYPASRAPPPPHPPPPPPLSSPEPAYAPGRAHRDSGQGMDPAVARRIARYRARRTRSAQRSTVVDVPPPPAEEAAQLSSPSLRPPSSQGVQRGYEEEEEEAPAEMSSDGSSESAVWAVASQDLRPASEAASQAPSADYRPCAPSEPAAEATVRPQAPRPTAASAASADGWMEQAGETWSAGEGSGGEEEEVDVQEGRHVHLRDPAPAPVHAGHDAESGTCAVRTAERRLCGRSPLLRLLLRPAIEDAVADQLHRRAGPGPAATMRLHAVLSPPPSGRERALRALEGDAAAEWMQRLPLRLHPASTTSDAVFSGLGTPTAQQWLLSRARRGRVLEALIQRPAPAGGGADPSAGQPVVVQLRRLRMDTATAPPPTEERAVDAVLEASEAVGLAGQGRVAAGEGGSEERTAQRARQAVWQAVERHQQRIFTSAGVPAARQALRGCDTTVVAVGPAGGGKSHLLWRGTCARVCPKARTATSQGLAPRTLATLFAAASRAEGRSLSAGGPQLRFRVEVGVMDVDERGARDLLNPAAWFATLPVRDTGSDGAVVVKGLSLHTATTSAEACALLEDAFRARALVGGSDRAGRCLVARVRVTLLRQMGPQTVRQFGWITFAEVASTPGPHATGPPPLDALRHSLQGSVASPKGSSRRRARGRLSGAGDPLWLLLGPALRGEAACHVLLALPAVGPRRETEQCLKLAGLLRRVRQRQRRRRAQAPRRVYAEGAAVEALRAEAHELRRQLASWDFRGEERSPGAHLPAGRRKALQRVLDTLSDREEELEQLQAPASEARRATLHLASLRRRLFAVAGAVSAPVRGLWEGGGEGWVAPAHTPSAAASLSDAVTVAWAAESTSEGSGDEDGWDEEDGAGGASARAELQPSLPWAFPAHSPPAPSHVSPRTPADAWRGNGTANSVDALSDSSDTGESGSPLSSSGSSSASEWERVFTEGAGSRGRRWLWPELGGHSSGRVGAADPRQHLHRRLARHGVPFLCSASADPTLHGALTFPLFVGDTRLAARRFPGLHVARGAEEGRAAAATQFVEALPPSQVQVLLAASLVADESTAAAAQAPLRATPVLEGIGLSRGGVDEGATAGGWGQEEEGGEEEEPQCVVRHTQHQGSADGAEERVWNHLELVIAPGAAALATDAEGRVVWDAREGRRDVPAACTLRSGALLSPGPGAGLLEATAPADWADSRGGADTSLVNEEEQGVLEGAVAGLLIGELGDAGVHMGAEEGAEVGVTGTAPAAEEGGAEEGEDGGELRGASPAEGSNVSLPPPVLTQEPGAKGGETSATSARGGPDGPDAKESEPAPTGGAEANGEGLTVGTGTEKGGEEILAAPLQRLVSAVGAELGLGEAAAGEVVQRARESAVGDAAAANEVLRALRMPLRCEVVAMCPRAGEGALSGRESPAAFAEPPEVQCEKAEEEDDLGLFVALRLAELGAGPDSVCLTPLGEVPFSEFAALAQALARERDGVSDSMAALGLPALSRRDGTAPRCLLRGERDSRRILPPWTADQLPPREEVAQRVVYCLHEAGVACDAEWAAQEVEARALEAAEGEGAPVRVVRAVATQSEGRGPARADSEPSSAEDASVDQ